MRVPLRDASAATRSMASIWALDVSSGGLVAKKGWLRPTSRGLLAGLSKGLTGALAMGAEAVERSESESLWRGVRCASSRGEPSTTLLRAELVRLAELAVLPARSLMYLPRASAMLRPLDWWGKE